MAGAHNTSDGSGIGGHSGWLRVLLETGIIGFALFAWFQILILRAILRMRGRERYVFLALLAAVNTMMLVSNSYALRIQVSQLYYIILAFIEIPPNRAQIEQVTVRAAN